jgi:hypothetical protein
MSEQWSRFLQLDEIRQPNKRIRFYFCDVVLAQHPIEALKKKHE